MPWPDTPADLVLRAYRYRQAGQWHYAATAYLQAAALVRERQSPFEAACLDCAWECSERAAGRVPTLEVE